MIYILLIIIVVNALSRLAYKKYGNPWKLHMVFGKKGSGKSSYLIKLAYKYQKKGYLVYTNMQDCVIPGVRIFDIKHLGDFIPVENSLLLVDEVGMIWDARDFKAFKPAVRDFFKLQRHYKCIVYLASQTFDVDKKIRDLCDTMMLCTNVATVFSLGRTITKRIVLTKASPEAESRISENLAFSPFWNWHLTYIPRYAKGYDSYAVPDLPKIPYKENPPSQTEKKKKKINLSIADRKRRPGAQSSDNIPLSIQSEVQAEET